MSVCLSILKHWIIHPFQNSIVVPIFNHFTTHSIQTLLLLTIILPIFNHFATNPIKTLLLLPIFLPILNLWIIDPLQNYIILPILNHLTTDRIQNHIILPILDLLPTHPIKKFLLLPIIGFIGKQIKDHLLKFFFNHLLKCVFVPIKPHICYPFKCDSYVEKLKKQIGELKEKRDSLEQSIFEADEVTKWLSSANNEINEAEALIHRKEEAKMKKCLFGLCPNFKSRYQLSKEADKKASAIDKLRDQEGLVPFSTRPPLQQIVERSVYSREALPSRVLILNQVMDALKDPKLYTIGVYGLGGVGKTTLAKEIQRKAMEEKMFKRAVMVPVSQTPDLRKIQEEIADFVDLKFDAQGVAGRASQLKERLEKSKVLIILDDIWTEFELNAVGIPLEDECKGSKLLLTSRSHDVLSREMGTQKEFSLEVLGEEETWKLFQTTLEDTNNPELQGIAIKVSKKCSGLPLLVNIVAADLKNKELSAWRDALVKLSDLDNEEIHGKVHKVLKSSYENLRSNDARSLFLLCSLFGLSNIPIKHLLTYAMGLGLFKNIVGVKVARDRLCVTIEKLKTESWLLDGDRDDCVKMHDVVLDFARSIAIKDEHAFFGINGNGLRQLWPVDNNCTRIALHHCNISEFPEGLEYPNAELLSLFTKDLNLVIPELFFKGIRKLKVLNLTGMCLIPMPSSLQFLINLRSLYLHRCQLDDVAIVGDLKQLEFLSFERSRIVELPTRLGELTQLKSLNLTKCSYLKVIPPDVLPKLSLLEELYIKSFDKWDLNGNASLMELEELRQLTTLEIRVSFPKKLPNQLFSKGLERYRILLGNIYWSWEGKFETSRRLKLILETSIHLENGLKELLRGSEDLLLGEVKGMENGLYDLNEEGFPKLKRLLIGYNRDIQHIIDSTIWVSCDAFPMLEMLHLFELNSLEEICHGRLGTRSFRKLRKLHIISCDKLINLFSFSTAKNLSQLQEMEVSNCNNLEVIIAEGSEDGICNPSKLSSETQTEMILFPNLTWLKVEECKSLKYIFKTSTVQSLLRLKSLEIKDCELMEEIILTEAKEMTDKIVFLMLDFLELKGLPNLISFSNGNFIEYQSLREMIINDYPTLKNFVTDISNNNSSNDVQSLFNEMAIFPNLQTMDVYGMNNLDYIWHGQFVDDDSFCKLKSLKIQQCSKLKAVFATSNNVMRRFQKLEELKVEDCDKMEVIYQMVELGSIDEVAFELRHLTIEFMPSLKQIWSEDGNRVFTFPNLKSVQVSRCRVLEYVFSESIASGLLQLEELKVERCKMEHVVGNTKSGEPYNFKWPKLKDVQLIKNSQKSNRLLPWLAKVGPNLEKLVLDGINWMKIQFSEIKTGSFSNLKVVEVHSLDDVKTCVEVHGFLTLLCSLKKLVLKNSRLGEVFLSDDERAVGEEKHYVSTVVRLECLELRRLGYLKYMWKEGSFVHSEYLKTVIVFYCDSMIKIAASSISFKNLTTLHVSKCKKLENLVTLSTAKTMEHLMKLRVHYCEMMTEVVADDGDDAAKHEIIFKQLKSLELICLSNLNNFCSRNNCTFHFPSLEKLLIDDCNELLMAILSHGNLITPKLRGVRSNRLMKEQHWKGNLNATIASILTKQEWLNIRNSSSFEVISPIQLQLMHNIRRINVTDSDKVQVVFDLEAISVASLLPQLQELHLIDLPMLTQLWNKDPVKILDFRQLGVLELDKCSSLKYAFTPSVATCFIQLKQIMVKNCEMMETLIKAKEAEERVALANKMILPSLESIDLECLPKLSSLHSGISILECPSLKQIGIINCPNLKNFISSLSRTKDPTDDEGRKQIQEIHQIATTSLEELVIDWDLIKCIFNGNNQPDFLSKLKAFALRGFHGECGVFPLKSFPNMERLVLSDSAVEDIIIPDLNVSEDKHLVDANDPQIASIFQNLKRFEVCEYGRLKILIPSSVCFKDLTYLEVSKCDEMINLITVSTAKSLVLLRTMSISQCKMMQEIVAVESDGSGDVIGFNQLEYLKLDHLPILTCFCSSNYAFDFPNLHEVTIIECPNMKTFSQQVLTPKLNTAKKLEWDSEHQDYKWEGSINNIIQKLYMRRQQMK